MDIQLQHIPLNRLCLSPNNPRKTPTSPEDHAAMVASIAAIGLIYPLITDPFDDTTDPIGVAAGGCRLAALQDLAAQGNVPPDHPVLCYACPEGTDPAEIALIENTIRAAMHPADQFVAFSNLAAQGASLDEIATRHGISVRTVERRLSLANVDPSLIDAYRADEMNLDTLMAFTLTTDHKLQRAVWKAAQNQPTYWRRNDARFVRQSLTEKRITADNRLARFATLDAYETAGGRITRDLFAENDSDIWLNDPQIARDVCSQLLEARADKLRADWGWVETTLDVPDYGMLDPYARYAPEPTAEETARLTEIDQRLEAIDGDHSIDPAASETEIDALEKEATALERRVSRRSIPKQYREKSGCIVGFDMSGKLSISRGLIRPEDMPAKTDIAGDNGVSISGTTSTSTARTAAPKVPKCYTDSHAAIMRSLRTAHLQVQLARNPDVARDILLYELARQLLPGVDTPDTWTAAKALDINVSPTEPQIRPDRDESFARAVAEQVELLDSIGASLPVSCIDTAKPDVGFRTIAALSDEQKNAVLAYCVARLPRHQLSFDEHRTDALEAATERLDTTPNIAFRPGAEVFWNRLRKSRILDIATDVIGETWAHSHAKDRKGDLVAHMEQVFADPANDPDVPAQAYDRIRAWAMPGFVAFDPDPVAPVTTDDGAGDDTDAPGAANEGEFPSTDDGNPTEEATLPEFLAA